MILFTFILISSPWCWMIFNSVPKRININKIKEKGRKCWMEKSVNVFVIRFNLIVKINEMSKQMHHGYFFRIVCRINKDRGRVFHLIMFWFFNICVANQFHVCLTFFYSLLDVSSGCLYSNFSWFLITKG
jgi:hypothetical protein